ncbi:MAG: hypothetical protein WBE48_21220, partial [Xanthobacteraceae bacterium]
TAHLKEKLVKLESEMQRLAAMAESCRANFRPGRQLWAMSRLIIRSVRRHAASILWRHRFPKPSRL